MIWHILELKRRIWGSSLEVDALERATCTGKARNRAKDARNRAKGAKDRRRQCLGPRWTDLGQTRPRWSKSRPRFLMARPRWSELGQDFSISAKIPDVLTRWRFCCQISVPTWPDLGRDFCPRFPVRRFYFIFGSVLAQPILCKVVAYKREALGYF